MVMLMQDWRAAAGIWNLDPMWRSMVLPCLVKRVGGCAKTMEYTTQVDQRGKSCARDLTSSSLILLLD